MSDDASALSTIAPTPPPADADYEAIRAALMKTARGRRFLAECARRNRNAEIAPLLAASERIEAAMRGERVSFDHIRFDLHEMAKAIARTKAEIAAIKPEREQHGKIGEASVELDSIVRSTETATSDILAAAEQIQETAWSMREQGVAADLCDELDARASAIYMACEFQDLTGQRTQKIIQVLRYLEDRINAMIDIWGGGAASAGDQRDIDLMLQAAPRQAANDGNDGRVPAISWFDGMPEPALEVAQTPPPTPPPAATSADELSDLLFEPAARTKTTQQPNMPWTPLDAIMPDWAHNNAAAASSAGPAPASIAKASSKPTSSDPLAPLKAMSDEEKIALFS
jgi:chemotaxis protein CheZ